MHKLRNNVVSASLVGLLALGVAACGGDEGNGAEAPAGGVEAPAAPGGGGVEAPAGGVETPATP